jgi:hypothetical protein
MARSIERVDHCDSTLSISIFVSRRTLVTLRKSLAISILIRDPMSDFAKALKPDYPRKT